MNPDAIVEDVRRARQRILENRGGDMEKLLERLNAAEAQDNNRVAALDSLQRMRQPRESHTPSWPTCPATEADRRWSFPINQKRL